MPRGCFYGKSRRRVYTTECCRISAIAFKPLLNNKSGYYTITGDQLSDQHKRFELIWAGGDHVVVEFTIDQKKIRVYLVQDNRSASNKLYIVCPYCKIRRQHLYAASNTYACRGCLRLHYPSQSKRSNIRLRQKIRNKRKKIWGEDWPDVNNLFKNSRYWPKPKGLHWKTF
ncbi:MAG: hypothetical protein ACJAS1_006068, partial [Oleiphilaceae bacterium]